MLTQNFDKNNYEFNPESTIGIYLIHGFSSSTYELKILAEFLSKKQELHMLHFKVFLTFHVQFCDLFKV